MAVKSQTRGYTFNKKWRELRVVYHTVGNGITLPGNVVETDSFKKIIGYIIGDEKNWKTMKLKSQFGTEPTWT